MSERIGAKKDYVEKVDYLNALDRGYQMQFQPAGRGHMRWVVEAMQNALTVRRNREALMRWLDQTNDDSHFMP